MWNRGSLLMFMRVRVLHAKHRIRIRLVFALYVIHQLLMSAEGLTCLIPGRPGMYLRAGLDSIHSIILAIMCMPPQEYVNVSLASDNDQILVRIKSMGLGGES